MIPFDHECRSLASIAVGMCLPFSPFGCTILLSQGAVHLLCTEDGNSDKRETKKQPNKQRRAQNTTTNERDRVEGNDVSKEVGGDFRLLSPIAGW